ncbi:uncharacterized protein LOC143592798 [Bidens hawaiensis]|uniref:uncharacterized protein LOC143592798 n=1 Tax=Bidens hawaiensis TaxID=980011 RepID=UPI00404B59F8
MKKPDKQGEAYFLRVLINRVKGPRSFLEVHTVNGQIYNTFRDTCYALGLLYDDAEYIKGIEEASVADSDIGEGKVGGHNDGKAKIEILDDLLIKKCDDPISSVIQFVYPKILNNIEDTNYFQKMVLLAPTNEIVNELNYFLIESFPGEPVEYLSSDSVSKSDYIDGNVDPTLYFTELLNGLKILGLPNHQLILKVEVLVMLLRNIDQKKGLCNDTRLQVISLCAHLIEVKILMELMLVKEYLFLESL